MHYDEVRRLTVAHVVFSELTIEMEQAKYQLIENDVTTVNLILN